MSSVAHKATPRQRRRPLLRSLRWRLTVWYVGLLAAILLVLGAVLLVTVSQLLYTSAYQRFAEEAIASAAVRHPVFENAIQRPDATGQCSTTFVDAFQSEMSDTLTQAPAHLDTVLLIDRLTGQVLAPSAAVGEIPAELHLDALVQLDNKVGTRLAQWRNAIARTQVTYRLTEQGTPAMVSLIPYDYHIVTACATGKYVDVPAVLMLSQNFAATQDIITSFKTDLAISVAALFVLGFALGVPITGAHLRRLSRVSVAAQRLAEGDLHQRVGLPPQDDEIGELGHHFDDMAAKLEAAFVQQHQSEERVRQFLSDASHELRTPLTSVRGYLDVLARQPWSQDPEAQRILQATRGEAERMTRLVSDMLTLARFDMGRPLELAPTDLGALIGEAVDQARLLAGPRSVTMQSDSPGRVLALVDRDRMKQVLLVLLDNALKYGRQDADAWVRVELSRTPQAIVLCVRDNGPGIAADDLPYLFDRFYRGKYPTDVTALTPAPQNGSGLGLTIARAIVTAHGGTIAITSEAGHGATFTITLPG